MEIKKHRKEMEEQSGIKMRGWREKLKIFPTFSHPIELPWEGRIARTSTVVEDMTERTLFTLLRLLYIYLKNTTTRTSWQGSWSYQHKVLEGPRNCISSGKRPFDPPLFD